MISRNALFGFISLLFFGVSPVHAQFEGMLELIPQGCQSTGQCTLKQKLRFTDGSNIVWEAKSGLVTDGASIPGIFQPLVGQPFEETFIKAAIIHDHYCDRHVRPWRQTHRVFFDALLVGGVPKAKAKAMYFAVVVGGPKWVKLIPSIYCGPGCVNSMKSVFGIPAVRYRPADYTAAGLASEVQNVLLQLELAPDSLTLDELDARANSFRPGDYYFKHGAEVTVSNAAAIE